MKTILTLCLSAVILSACSAEPKSAAIDPTDYPAAAKTYSATCPAGAPWSIAIHGGAGVIEKQNFTPEREAEYRAALNSVLERGAGLLEDGVSGLDAVGAMINMMEDDEKFNAGRGSVLSAAAINEMDASIMDGRDRNAGAVSSVTTVRNSIDLARAVMDQSRHVMLSGEGAEQFAAAQGLQIVPRDYFKTERRVDQLRARMEKREGSLTPETRFGTVGAAVRDGCANLSAGTSTGGLTAKEFGRVGDAPIIGAGTYADNNYCAVSATGTGEYFIRAGIAKEVCTRMQYAGEDLQTAMDFTIHTTLTDMGGDGGIIAVDSAGNFGFSFNTAGMYRGAASRGSKPIVQIFGEGE